jgi:uncharacterized protein
MSTARKRGAGWAILPTVLLIVYRMLTCSKALLRLVCLAGSVLLAACNSTSTGPQPPLPPVVDVVPLLPPTAEDLVTLAASLTPTEAIPRLMEAASLHRAEGDLNSASAALDRIFQAALNPLQAMELAILRAELALDRNLPREALLALQVEGLPNPDTLPTALQIRFHEVRAIAQEANGAILVSALERISLDALLSATQQRTNHDRIWQALATLPQQQLQSLAATATNAAVRGWYELALVARSFGNDLDRQLIELQRWRAGWAAHPAALVLPPQMELMETLARERPRQIALLLPFGTNAGAIVRDAFMSAYFSLQELGGQVPVVKFYDTTDVTDILQLHRQARSEGAQLIIGPLAKQHVATLHGEADLVVPTLALNNVEGQAPSSPQLYLFALSPEDEARQLAAKAWEDGHRYVAIFSPPDSAENELFMRKREAFRETWTALGGRIAVIDSYQENYTDSISRMLLLDESTRRSERLEDLLGRSLVTEQRRRQDIDCILLLATPAAGRQIVPSLAYLFAGDIPVYASQDVNSGVARQTDDRDLNGVRFGESPWLLGVSGDVGRARQLFPMSTATTLRLQAFGIDAFRLYPRLRLLESSSSASIPGVSGLLRLGPNHNIVRQLSWATISDGLITTAP